MLGFGFCLLGWRRSQPDCWVAAEPRGMTRTVEICFVGGAGQRAPEIFGGGRCSRKGLFRPALCNRPLYLSHAEQYTGVRGSIFCSCGLLQSRAQTARATGGAICVRNSDVGDVLCGRRLRLALREADQEGVPLMEGAAVRVRVPVAEPESGSEAVGGQRLFRQSASTVCGPPKCFLTNVGLKSLKGASFGHRPARALPEEGGGGGCSKGALSAADPGSPCQEGGASHATHAPPRMPPTRRTPRVASHCRRPCHPPTAPHARGALEEGLLPPPPTFECPLAPRASAMQNASAPLPKSTVTALLPFEV